MPADGAGLKRKRSRTGCLTCRKRKKKCDEVTIASSCQRCRALGLRCHWPQVVDTQHDRRVPLLTRTHIQRDHPKPGADSCSPSEIVWFSEGPSSRGPQQKHCVEEDESNDQHTISSVMPGNGDMIRPVIETVQLLDQVNPSPDLCATHGTATWAGPGTNAIGHFTSCPHILTALSARSTMDGSVNATLALLDGDGDSSSGLAPEHDDLYTILSDSLLSSIPSTIRQFILSRARDIVRCHSVSWTARKAVTSAYRDLFRREGLGKLRLTEHNNKAIARCVMSIYDAATDQRLGFRASETTELAHIQTVLLLLEDPATDLESKMLAIMDMHLYQLARYGAFTAHMVLELGDLILKHGLGHKPALELSTLAIQECFVYRMFAYSDVSRTICQRGRKTAFTLVGLPGDHDDKSCVTRKRDAPKPIYNDEYIGLPPTILLCLAAISNLTVDMSSMSTTEVLLKAVNIETCIRTWRPNNTLLDLDDDAARMSRTAVREIWRTTALIYLYQSIYGEEPLSHNLRNCLASILQLLEGVPPFTGHLACPWFLAGTIAVSMRDKMKCRDGLLRCGPEKVWRDDCDALDIIWQERDITGVTEDWRAVLERAGACISFF